MWKRLTSLAALALAGSPLAACGSAGASGDYAAPREEMTEPTDWLEYTPIERLCARDRQNFFAWAQEPDWPHGALDPAVDDDLVQLSPWCAKTRDEYEARVREGYGALGYSSADLDILAAQARIAPLPRLGSALPPDDLLQVASGYYLAPRDSAQIAEVFPAKISMTGFPCDPTATADHPILPESYLTGWLAKIDPQTLAAACNCPPIIDYAALGLTPIDVAFAAEGDGTGKLVGDTRGPGLDDNPTVCGQAAGIWRYSASVHFDWGSEFPARLDGGDAGGESEAGEYVNEIDIDGLDAVGAENFDGVVFWAMSRMSSEVRFAVQEIRTTPTTVVAADPARADEAAALNALACRTPPELEAREAHFRCEAALGRSAEPGEDACAALEALGLATEDAPAIGSLENQPSYSYTQVRGCGDNFGTPIRLDATWRPYVIPWSRLQQEGWGKHATMGLDHTAGVKPEFIFGLVFSIEKTVEAEIWLTQPAFFSAGSALPADAVVVDGATP